MTINSTCYKCYEIAEVDPNKVAHVIRKCESCGREMFVVEPGKNGKGIYIRKGDRFRIPPGLLRMSFNPLDNAMQFTRIGLGWFARMIFIEQAPHDQVSLNNAFKANEKVGMDLLKKSKLLKGLDVSNAADEKQISELILPNKESLEYYALAFLVFNTKAELAVAADDALTAAWAAMNAERFRSMVIFKQHLEEVVWMGQSAGRLIQLLTLWYKNRRNSQEYFWQTSLKEYSFILSQLFSVPVVFIKDNAYVGGMNIHRKDGRLVDYLFSTGSSNEAILIEIKTPVTKLLGGKYRNSYKISAELNGAVMQALDYRVTLIENIKSTSDNVERPLEHFNPKCLIIIGDGENELTDSGKRRSFELFRTNLQNVEVVTYDELFKKIEILAKLFNLAAESKS